MGAYHGKLTFDMFTHRKAAIFKKQARRGPPQQPPSLCLSVCLSVCVLTNRIGWAATQSLEFVNAPRYPPYTPGKSSTLDLVAKRGAPSSFRVPWRRVFVVVLLAVVAARIRVTNPGFISGVQAFFGL
jgi:hypothetical protein